MITLLESPLNDEILYQKAKDFHERTDSNDEMIVLFCMLVGHTDIESEMIKSTKN